MKIDVPERWNERVLAYASRHGLGDDAVIVNWYSLGGGYLHIQRGYYGLYAFSLKRRAFPRQYFTIICIELRPMDENGEESSTYLFEFFRFSVFCAMHELKTSYNLVKDRRYATILGGSVTDAQWEIIKAHYDYSCVCCGRQEPEIVLTVDHIIPRSKGGTSLLKNIQPLCRRCNSAKHDKIVDYRQSYFARNAIAE